MTGSYPCNDTLEDGRLKQYQCNEPMQCHTFVIISIPVIVVVYLEYLGQIIILFLATSICIGLVSEHAFIAYGAHDIIAKINSQSFMRSALYPEALGT